MSRSRSIEPFLCFTFSHLRPQHQALLHSVGYFAMSNLSNHWSQALSRSNEAGATSAVTTVTKYSPIRGP
ncbi:hypothetical protein BX600DRAFT_52217 [Xylariales sp. PMI_506]|nr:hypothetical protein BX600DRAFT_52217 [Xylariales sp. PMI_506]